MTRINNLQVSKTSLSGLIMGLFFCSCVGSSVNNHKDLDENMLDMMMYHDNLGLYLRNQDADYSLWLLNGMDSSLKVISKKFDTHRKLSEPFEHHYNKLLSPPIEDIRAALGKKDFPSAVTSYKLLTKNCNGCHADHEVDKKVFDRTIPETDQ